MLLRSSRSCGAAAPYSKRTSSSIVTRAVVVRSSRTSDRSSSSSSSSSSSNGGFVETDRRGALMSSFAALAAAAAAALVPACPPAAQAIDGNPFKKDLSKGRRRRQAIPLEDYKDGPEGLKYYELQEGGGAEAKVGDRVAIHFDVKFRGVTLQTSRMGAGVTGGVPQGFDVGLDPGSPGSIGLKGIDLGVRGMRVGGVRRLIVPPQLGFGSRQAGELPPDSTIDVDIELLSIKNKRVL